MTEEILEENTPVEEDAPMEEPALAEPEKTAREISEEVISTVKSICPQLEESVILDIDENDNIIFKIIDHKKFDVLQDSLFYKENHPEDENSDKVNKLLEDIYEGVAIACNTKKDGFGIYNFNNRYFVTTKEDFEQLRYNSLTDEEKATEDKEKEQNAIRNKRRERDEILVNVVDPIVSNPLRWDELSTDEQESYRQYRLYLLDIPQQARFPNIDIMSLEDFKKTLETSD